MIPALLVTLLPATPASAAEVTETYHVPSVDGFTIRVEVTRDTSFASVPVLLTYSPYNTLNEPNPSQDAYATTFVPKGYARAVADVLGTRGSGGCWDYGGLDEQQSGVDVVKFLAAQPWSSGKVAMIGGSYDGTTATMVAARGPDVPELKAIIPIAGINHWYGYAYGNGIRYFLNSQNPGDEGFDTPLAFDYGFNRTVAPDPHDPNFAATLINRIGTCETESLQHTQEGYSNYPDYDQFWLERDYRKDATDFRAAVLLAHGWQDYNVKQEEGVALWETLPVDDPGTGGVEGVPFKLMYLTQGTHGGATSGEEWGPLLERFLEHTLKGVDNGIDTEPARVITRGRTVDDAAAYSTLPPSFETDWPPPGTTDLALHLHRTAGNAQPGTLEEGPANDGVYSYESDGSATEEASMREPTGSPSWLFYQSGVLERDLRLTGSALLDVRIRVEAARTHLTPVLVDIAPNGTLRQVERGFLHLDYRNGLEQADLMVPGEWAQARVTFLPQDFTFTAGHKVGLLLQSTNTVWAVPGANGTVDISHGAVPARGEVEGTRLLLPTPTSTTGGLFVERCKGRPVTIAGTNGRDRLRGTKGADVISSLNGRDRIKGRGGRDVICAGKGKDRLAGGGGKDLLVGGRGVDVLNGGGPGAGRQAGPGRRGGDRCTGGKGRDRLKGCERGRP